MLSQRLMLMLVFSMEPMAMVPVLDMLDLDIPVLDTMARGLLMPSLRLMLMLVFSMEPMAMVPGLDMLDLDIPVLDMLDMVVMDLAMAVLAMVVLATMARGLLMLSLRLKLMLVFSMEPMAMVPVLDMLDLDMDIPVLDMLDMVVMDSAMAVLAMLVLATMARGLLRLSLRLKLMLVFFMELMAMVPVLDMLDLDMDDTVLDMDVPSMVKQLIYASKSSKVIFLLFSALLRGRNFVFHVQIK